LEVRFLLGALNFIFAQFLMVNKDDLFMSEALKEAERAFDSDEVPIGAVVAHQGMIIARGHNQVERLKDPTAHAEMIALTSACNSLSTKWLNGATLYVTIEPCAMCAGALVLARISCLVYGAKDPKCGGCGSVVNVVSNHKLNHRVKVKTGILEDECSSLIREFFKRKRAARK
jgi:tRNA(adenine34) deaminase